MSGQGGAVAWQRQAQGFGQAVHGVCGKHAGARTTGRTSRFLDQFQAGIIHFIASRCRDRRNQVRRCLGDAINNNCLAGFHWAAGDEDGGDVQTQRCVEHARGDLVTVRNTHQGIGSVRVDHVLHGVRNDLTRWQGVEHAGVAHGDTVIDRDGVEFFRNTACFTNGVSNNVTDILQVNVARNELSIRVSNSHDWPAELIFLGAGCAPERASTRCLTADGGYFRAQRKHRNILKF